MKRRRKRRIFQAPDGGVRSEILNRQCWILFKDHVVKSFQKFLQVKVPVPQERSSQFGKFLMIVLAVR